MSHDSPSRPAHGSHHAAASPVGTLDLSEKGAPIDGQPQRLDERLFMQLLVFELPEGADAHQEQNRLKEALAANGIASVGYADVNHPRRVGLLSFGTDPAVFVERVRPLFSAGALSSWTLVPSLTMIGRTYSSGYESDLQFWMLDRPVQTVLNPKWPWAVWYPLRRKGAFEQLQGQEKGSILREHATIGRTYGEHDLAHDVRLACHGLDESDNEFVIGLVGSELYPLSHVVQRMRSTVQTSTYMEKMGPFFVGKVLWQLGRKAP
ncbi:MAG: chlorite dismutase family protein [Polyangiales bacterium]